jgi:hypothetical protein
MKRIITTANEGLTPEEIRAKSPEEMMIVYRRLHEHRRVQFPHLFPSRRANQESEKAA